MSKVSQVSRTRTAIIRGARGAVANSTQAPSSTAPDGGNAPTSAPSIPPVVEPPPAQPVASSNPSATTSAAATSDAGPVSGKVSVTPPPKPAAEPIEDFTVAFRSAGFIEIGSGHGTHINSIINPAVAFSHVVIRVKQGRYYMLRGTSLSDDHGTHVLRDGREHLNVQLKTFEIKVGDVITFNKGQMTKQIRIVGFTHEAPPLIEVSQDVRLDFSGKTTIVVGYLHFYHRAPGEVFVIRQKADGRTAHLEHAGNKRELLIAERAELSTGDILTTESSRTRRTLRIAEIVFTQAPPRDVMLDFRQEAVLVKATQLHFYRRATGEVYAIRQKADGMTAHLVHEGSQRELQISERADVAIDDVFVLEDHGTRSSIRITEIRTQVTLPTPQPEAAVATTQDVPPTISDLAPTTALTAHIRPSHDVTLDFGSEAVLVKATQLHFYRRNTGEVYVIRQKTEGMAAFLERDGTRRELLISERVEIFKGDILVLEEHGKLRALRIVEICFTEAPPAQPAATADVTTKDNVPPTVSDAAPATAQADAANSANLPPTDTDPQPAPTDATATIDAPSNQTLMSATLQTGQMQASTGDATAPDSSPKRRGAVKVIDAGLERFLCAPFNTASPGSTPSILQPPQAVERPDNVTLVLTKGYCSIGSAAGCDLPLVDDSVALIHLHVVPDKQGGYQVTHQESGHTTSLKRGDDLIFLLPSVPYKLLEGDILTLKGSFDRAKMIRIERIIDKTEPRRVAQTLAGIDSPVKPEETPQDVTLRLGPSGTYVFGQRTEGLTGDPAVALSHVHIIRPSGSSICYLTHRPDAKGYATSLRRGQDTFDVPVAGEARLPQTLFEGDILVFWNLTTGATKSIRIAQIVGGTATMLGERIELPQLGQGSTAEPVRPVADQLPAFIAPPFVPPPPYVPPSAPPPAVPTVSANVGSILPPPPRAGDLDPPPSSDPAEHVADDEVDSSRDDMPADDIVQSVHPPPLPPPKSVTPAAADDKTIVTPPPQSSEPQGITLDLSDVGDVYLNIGGFLNGDFSVDTSLKGTCAPLQLHVRQNTLVSDHFMVAVEDNPANYTAYVLSDTAEQKIESDKRYQIIEGDLLRFDGEGRSFTVRIDQIIGKQASQPLSQPHAPAAPPPNPPPPEPPVKPVVQAAANDGQPAPKLIETSEDITINLNAQGEAILGISPWGCDVTLHSGDSCAVNDKHLRVYQAGLPGLGTALGFRIMRLPGKMGPRRAFHQRAELLTELLEGVPHSILPGDQLRFERNDSVYIARITTINAYEAPVVPPVTPAAPTGPDPSDQSNVGPLPSPKPALAPPVDFDVGTKGTILIGRTRSDGKLEGLGIGGKYFSSKAVALIHLQLSEDDTKKGKFVVELHPGAAGHITRISFRENSLEYQRKLIPGQPFEIREGDRIHCEGNGEKCFFTIGKLSGKPAAPVIAHAITPPMPQPVQAPPKVDAPVVAPTPAPAVVAPPVVNVQSVLPANMPQDPNAPVNNPSVQGTPWSSPERNVVISSMFIVGFLFAAAVYFIVFRNSDTATKPTAAAQATVQATKAIATPTTTATVTATQRVAQAPTREALRATPEPTATTKRTAPPKPPQAPAAKPSVKPTPAETLTRCMPVTNELLKQHFGQGNSHNFERISKFATGKIQCVHMPPPKSATDPTKFEVSDCNVCPLK